MKITKKFLSVLCMAAMLVSCASFTFSASAAAETKKFLDPFDSTSYTKEDGHWTFNKAYKYNVKLPDNYDVDLKKIDSGSDGGVFGFNPNKPALAAFSTGKTLSLFKEFYSSYKRTSNLMKNYVAVDLEIIYYFENGFQDFEFMGIASSDSGTGNWAGAWGMEENPPVDFAFSDSADGGWTTMKYSDLRVLPSEAASTYCYFTNGDRNTSKSKPSIPTSARYLKIHFTNGCTYNSATGKWDPHYENWQCVLGYLLVDEYTSAQSGTSATSANKTTAASNKATTTAAANKATTTAAGNKATTTAANGTVGETETDGSDETPVDNGDTDDNTLTENDDTDTVVSTDENGTTVTTVKREIDWKITGIIIGCDVLVMAAAIVIMILVYRKKMAGK